MYEASQRMLLATALLAAVAALLAGPASAVLLAADGDSGGGGGAAATSAPIEQLSGQPSLGLTGDSALTAGQNEIAQPSLGLTGDSALTRTGQNEIAPATQSASVSDDRDWTWVGFGAGMAVLAAALTGVFFSARHRGRVALP